MGHESWSERPTRTGALPDVMNVRPRRVPIRARHAHERVERVNFRDASAAASQAHQTRADENAASASPKSRSVSAPVPTCGETRTSPERTVTVRPWLASDAARGAASCGAGARVTMPPRRSGSRGEPRTTRTGSQRGAGRGRDPERAGRHPPSRRGLRCRAGTAAPARSALPAGSSATGGSRRRDPAGARSGPAATPRRTHRPGNGGRRCRPGSRSPHSGRGRTRGRIRPATPRAPSGEREADRAGGCPRRPIPRWRRRIRRGPASRPGSCAHTATCAGRRSRAARCAAMRSAAASR